MTSFASAVTQRAVRSDGRFGGRVTRTPLPPLGEVALSASERAEIAAIWRLQAATEARVATSFEVVHEALAALGADAGLVRLAARGVDDEHRHAALCEDVAGRYLGRVVEPYEPLPSQQPLHPGASDEVRRALFVIGQCCLNETFASAYLSVAQQGATIPLARAALKALLGDEIDHARVGWGFVQTLDGAVRAEVQAWLLPLTVCNLREWRAIRLPEDDRLAAHGIPSSSAAQAAITEVLEGVVIEGFAHAGFDTTGLVAWSRRGAPVHLAASDASP